MNTKNTEAIYDRMITASNRGDSEGAELYWSWYCHNSGRDTYFSDSDPLADIGDDCDINSACREEMEYQAELVSEAINAKW